MTNLSTAKVVRRWIGRLNNSWPWLRRLVFIAAVILLIRLIAKNVADVRSTLTGLNYLDLALAIIFSGLGFCFGSFSWRALLAAQGVHLTVRQAWWSSSYSLLIRYLPGGVPGAAARVEAMRKFNIPISHGSWNLLIEMGVSACTALIFFIGGGWVSHVAVWITIAAISGLISGLAALWLLTAFRRPAEDWRDRLGLPKLAISEVVFMLAWFMAVWFSFGWAHWFLLQGIGLGKAISFWPLTGAFALSWVAGLVAIFAPAGIGVREAVMISLLQPTLGAGAITMSLLSRLVQIAGESLNLVMAIFMKPRKGNL